MSASSWTRPIRAQYNREHYTCTLHTCPILCTLYTRAFAFGYIPIVCQRARRLHRLYIGLEIMFYSEAMQTIQKNRKVINIYKSNIIIHSESLKTLIKHTIHSTGYMTYSASSSSYFVNLLEYLRLTECTLVLHCIV